MEGQVSATGIFPDYNSFITLNPRDKSFTATQNSWIIFQNNNQEYSYIEIFIGNYYAYIGAGRDDSHGRWFGLPIKKGQVVKWNTNDYNKAKVYAMPMI